jgi:hypothetical protein
MIPIRRQTESDNKTDRTEKRHEVVAFGDASSLGVGYECPKEGQGGDKEQ